MADRVLVIGGGLAGLAAAQALAQRNFSVTLLESRDRLGGRAGSFPDAGGQLLDACQHVSMGCCTNLAHFWRTVGVAHHLRPQPCLYFMTPDRRVSPFGADSIPAPLHLARAFLGAHFLTLADKGRIAYGLAKLRLTSPDDDRPFADWLRHNRQTPAVVRRFWGLVLISALNEEPALIGLKYARKVFVDAFLRHRDGFVVEVPAVPLGRLYGEEMLAWMAGHRVELRLNDGVKRILFAQGRAAGVELRDGSCLDADWVVSAVPHERLPALLPDEVGRMSYFADPQNLQSSPITSAHLWYDRPVTKLPHVVLVDCVGQWVFNRGEVAPGEHYVQVVVSASRALHALGHDEVRRVITQEMANLFPAASSAKLLRCRVVTEKSATFSAVPGVDRWRPAQTSPVPRLFVAGDWTATGWPATMEGAVRSGYLAAEAILQASGRPESVARPDLR